MSKILDSRSQMVGEWGQLLGISRGITRGRSVGKEIAQLWESGVLGVVHNIAELFTKLSTGFSTAIAEIYSTIHRLYYYNYFN